MTAHFLKEAAQWIVKNRKRHDMKGSARVG